MKTLIATAIATLLPVVGAIAETAQPGQSSAAADKVALERAQQLADGPRRRILEAAKLKAVARTPDLPPPGAAAVAAPAPPPVATPVALPQRQPDPEPVVATLRAAVAPLALPAGGAAAMQGVAPVELTASTTALAALPTPLAAINLAGLPPPRLVSKVDPELPTRLFRRGAGRTEVTLDLVVNADGSVRDIALRPGTNPEFEPPVIDAVRQWRYEPQPVARPHVVRLVVAPS